MDLSRKSVCPNAGCGRRSRWSGSSFPVAGKWHWSSWSGFLRTGPVGLPNGYRCSSCTKRSQGNQLKIRDMTAEEYDALQSRRAPDGIEYKYLLPAFGSGLIETAFSIESDTGERIASGIAIRTAEIALIMETGFHPTVKEAAIGQIHREMRSRMHAKGYRRGFACVPPFLRAYVRHMMRKFGWQRDYPAYRIE